MPEAPVLPEFLPVIGHEHDNGIVVKAAPLQFVEEGTDAVVDVGHLAVVEISGGEASLLVEGVKGHRVGPFGPFCQ